HCQGERPVVAHRSSRRRHHRIVGVGIGLLAFSVGYRPLTRQIGGHPASEVERQGQDVEAGAEVGRGGGCRRLSHGYIEDCAFPWRTSLSESHESRARGPTRRSRTVSNERRSEEHTSELQSRENLVCRLLLEKKKKRDE